jgi:hypothetical protein
MHNFSFPFLNVEEHDDSVMSVFMHVMQTMNQDEILKIISNH